MRVLQLAISFPQRSFSQPCLTLKQLKKQTWKAFCLKLECIVGGHPHKVHSGGAGTKVMYNPLVPLTFTEFWKVFSFSTENKIMWDNVAWNCISHAASSESLSSNFTSVHLLMIMHLEIKDVLLFFSVISNRPEFTFTDIICKLVDYDFLSGGWVDLSV